MEMPKATTRWRGEIESFYHVLKRELDKGTSPDSTVGVKIKDGETRLIFSDPNLADHHKPLASAHRAHQAEQSGTKALIMSLSRACVGELGKNWSFNPLRKPLERLDNLGGQPGPVSLGELCEVMRTAIDSPHWHDDPTIPAAKQDTKRKDQSQDASKQLDDPSGPERKAARERSVQGKPVSKLMVKQLSTAQLATRERRNKTALKLVQDRLPDLIHEVVKDPTKPSEAPKVAALDKLLQLSQQPDVTKKQLKLETEKVVAAAKRKFNPLALNGKQGKALLAEFEQSELYRLVFHANNREHSDVYAKYYASHADTNEVDGIVGVDGADRVDGADGLKSFLSRQAVRYYIDNHGLTVEEAVAIHLYTADAYKAINPQVWARGQLSPDVECTMRLLKSGLPKLPSTQNRKLVRTLDSQFMAPEIMQAMQNPLRYFTNTTPASATKNLKMQFAGGDVKLTIIPAPDTAGVDVYGLSDAPQEEETIFPPGTRFLIQDNPDPKTMTWLELPRTHQK